MQRRKLLTVGSIVCSGIGSVSSIGSASLSTNAGKKMEGEPIKLDYTKYRDHEPTRKMLENEAFITEREGDHVLIYLNRDHFEKFSDVLDSSGDMTVSDVHEHSDEMLENRLEERDRNPLKQRLLQSIKKSDNGNNTPSPSTGNTIVIGEDDDLYHPNTLNIVEKSIPATVKSLYGNGMNEAGYPLHPGFHFEALPTGGLGTMNMECFHYRSVSVEGSTAEIGNISGKGFFDGFLFAAGSSINVESEFVVINADTGAIETAELYSQSGSWFDRTVDKDESGSLDVYLAPGHNYHIGYRMSTTISVSGGGASVDFGSVEYDRYGDYVQSENPEVYFY